MTLEVAGEDGAAQGEEAGEGDEAIENALEMASAGGIGSSCSITRLGVMLKKTRRKDSTLFMVVAPTEPSRGEDEAWRDVAVESRSVREV